MRCGDLAMDRRLDKVRLLPNDRKVYFALGMLFVVALPIRFELLGMRLSPLTHVIAMFRMLRSPRPHVFCF